MPLIISSYPEIKQNKDKISFDKLSKILNIRLYKNEFDKNNYHKYYYKYDGHYNKIGTLKVAKNVLNYLNIFKLKNLDQ